MDKTIEQQAREILAAELDADGRHFTARVIRNGGTPPSLSLCQSLRAITRALESAGQGEDDAWKPSNSDYDRAIHSNPDASAWADLFVATFPGLADKRDLMLGWFANAMMAMHDHVSAKPVTVTPEVLMAVAGFFHDGPVRDWRVVRSIEAYLASGKAAPQQPEAQAGSEFGAPGCEDCAVHGELRMKLRVCEATIKRLVSEDNARFAAEAQAGGAVAGLVGVQRYFPSKPSHAGWEMTADERGEWVLWSDVVAALAQRRATVERHEPSGLDSCQPISWLVKLDGKQFVVHDEATARWWADRLTTPPAKVPEGYVLVPVEPTPEIIAGAAAAIWPTASAADIDLARKAAPIVLMSYDLSADYTVDELAAVLATMAPAYRAMLAAAPAPKEDA